MYCVLNKTIILFFDGNEYAGEKYAIENAFDLEINIYVLQVISVTRYDCYN